MGLDVLQHHTTELGVHGYTVVAPDVLVPTVDRLALSSTLFTDERLEPDSEAVHPCRSRTDDIVCFSWHEEKLILQESPASLPDASRIDIQLTRNFTAPRSYRRFEALRRPALEALIRAVLHLVPAGERRVNGRCGVHAIRTNGVVVPVWHRDGNRKSPVDWVIAYVVSKTGMGGRTKLAADRQGHEVVFECELAPGQLIMHKDDRYYHYVTPVAASVVGERPERCAVVIMLRP